MKNILTGYLAFFSIASALILPSLFMEGMFMDGLIYSTLSRNMAVGDGSIWAPYFAEFLRNPFYEHPPLAFYLQSFLFKIFGDHFWVERLFSLINFCFTGLFIFLIWRILGKNKREKEFAWLPLIIWILFPVIQWSYTNNMLENSISVFSLGAIYFMLLGLRKKSLLVPLNLLAGGFIIAGFLVKGPVAIFPLATLPVLWLAENFKGTSRKLIGFVSMLAGVTAIGYLLYRNPESNAALSKYLDSQLFASLKGERAVVGRFHILGVLAKQMLIPLAFSGVFIMIANFRKKLKIDFSNNASLLFILITAISASLPIMISPKQLSFYIVPSLPWFAMLLACFILKFRFEIYLKLKLLRIVHIFFGLILISSIVATVYLWEEPKRDSNKIAMVDEIGKITGKDAVVEITPSLRPEWSLHGYLARRHYISLLHTQNSENQYFLCKKADKNLNPFKNYKQHEIGNGFILFAKK